MTRLRSIRAGAVTAALLLLGAQLGAQTLDSATVAGLRWRNLGPANFEGRLSDVVGIPGPSKTLFVAAAAGGIWKTMNNGFTWRPVFDDKRVISMGMLAFAQRAETELVGTGQRRRSQIAPPRDTLTAQERQIAELARDGLNPQLSLLGVLLNRADMRTVHSREALASLRERFGEQVFDTAVRASIAYAESAERATSILDHRPDLGEDYVVLADEVLGRLSGFAQARGQLARIGA